MPRPLMYAVAVVAVSITPAAAETRLAGGFVMGQPIAGVSGGADYALAAHIERVLRADVDVGLTIEGGYSPGNADESLARFAVLPAVGVRGLIGELTVRADVAVGWQLANGETKIAGLPVKGTEPHGVRAELGIGLETPLTRSIALRARGGLVFDGIYPATVRGISSLGPFVELALVFEL